MYGDDACAGLNDLISPYGLPDTNPLSLTLASTLFPHPRSIALKLAALTVADAGIIHGDLGYG